MKTPPAYRVMISHATLAAFLRYRGMTSKSYTGYPQIPELVDSLLAQTSNPETQLSATPVAMI